MFEVFNTRTGETIRYVASEVDAIMLSNLITGSDYICVIHGDDCSCK